MLHGLAGAWDVYGILHRLTEDFTVVCGVRCMVEVKTAIVGTDWLCPDCYPEEER